MILLDLIKLMTRLSDEHWTLLTSCKNLYSVSSFQYPYRCTWDPFSLRRRLLIYIHLSLFQRKINVGCLGRTFSLQVLVNGEWYISRLGPSLVYTGTGDRVRPLAWQGRPFWTGLVLFYDCLCLSTLDGSLWRTGPVGCRRGTLVYQSSVVLLRGTSCL